MATKKKGGNRVWHHAHILDGKVTCALLLAALYRDLVDLYIESRNACSSAY